MQPAFQNSNGRFTTLVILVLYSAGNDPRPQMIAVRDHLRFNLGIISDLGIINFAVGDHLRRCTVVKKAAKSEKLFE